VRFSRDLNDGAAFGAALSFWPEAAEGVRAAAYAGGYGVDRVGMVGIT
jgi:hypothetical protein